MSGKLFTSGLFTTVIVGGIVGAVILFLQPRAGSAGTVAGVAAGTAALVFLLNTVGLNVGSKKLGGAGLLLSLAVIGVGVYWLLGHFGSGSVGGDSSDMWNTIAVGALMGVGVLGVLGSLGAISAA